MNKLKLLSLFAIVSIIFLISGFYFGLIVGTNVANEFPNIQIVEKEVKVPYEVKVETVKIINCTQQISDLQKEKEQWEIMFQKYNQTIR